MPNREKVNARARVLLSSPTSEGFWNSMPRRSDRPTAATTIRPKSNRY
jgi:hypothetical protein